MLAGSSVELLMLRMQWGQIGTRTSGLSIARSVLQPESTANELAYEPFLGSKRAVATPVGRGIDEAAMVSKTDVAMFAEAGDGKTHKLERTRTKVAPRLIIAFLLLQCHTAAAATARGAAR